MQRGTLGGEHPEGKDGGGPAGRGARPEERGRGPARLQRVLLQTAEGLRPEEEEEAGGGRRRHRRPAAPLRRGVPREADGAADQGQESPHSPGRRRYANLPKFYFISMASAHIFLSS